MSGNIHQCENHPEKSTSSGNEPKSTITATDSSDQNIFEGKFPGLQTPCLQRLKNHGNTDYFSALMHCLSGCDRFAEFILCNDFVEYEENIIFNSFINTIRCMWFNHSYVDTYFHKTIIALASENSTFCLGYQHDSHECMVWLLNQLNREIMDSNLEGKSWKGSTVENNKDKISTILELFQGKFRHEIKCTAPNCDFIDSSLEPFLSVSLSVPLPRKYTVKFITMTPRKITRFHLNISDPYLTIRGIMEQIEKVVKISPENMVACKTKPDGQSYLIPDNVILESDSQLNDFTILQIPGEINKQLEQKLIVAIVNFVFDGKIFGEPYIAVLYKDLSYDQLSFELAEKGAFLLPKPYYNMNLYFKLLLKDSAGSVYCSLKNFDGKGYCSQTLHGFTHYYDPATLKPFLNIYLDKILNEKENNKKVIQIIVDWDLSLKEDFEKNSMKEEIKDDNSLQNKFIESKQTPVSLISMLDKFVKPEPIQFWTCPKCKKPSGSMQIKFDRLSDILVFYIKRFDHSGENTKNNIEIVHSPEELDMSSYFINKLSKNSDENKYDLSCVIFHNGSEFSSGHYTAAVRNFIDGKWRLFNDNEVLDKTVNEICSSSNSYILFYQRRRRSIPWFPQNVPYHIIKKYQKESVRDERDYNKQPWFIRFFAPNSFQNIEEDYTDHISIYLEN